MMHTHTHTQNTHKDLYSEHFVKVYACETCGFVGSRTSLHPYYKAPHGAERRNWKQMAANEDATLRALEKQKNFSFSQHKKYTNRLSP